MTKEKGISLVTSDRALDELGKIGFDPVYGARPLKREIQQVIENPIAKALLSAEYGEGDTIKVDVDDEGNFLFSS